MFFERCRWKHLRWRYSRTLQCLLQKHPAIGSGFALRVAADTGGRFSGLNGTAKTAAPSSPRTLLAPSAVAGQVHGQAAPQKVADDTYGQDKQDNHAACLVPRRRSFNQIARPCPAHLPVGLPGKTINSPRRGAGNTAQDVFHSQQAKACSSSATAPQILQLCLAMPATRSGRAGLSRSEDPLPAQAQTRQPRLAQARCCGWNALSAQYPETADKGSRLRQKS